jgi:hypothetical protein
MQFLARPFDERPRPRGHVIRAVELSPRTRLYQLKEVRRVAQEDRLAHLRAAPGVDAQLLRAGVIGFEPILNVQRDLVGEPDDFARRGHLGVLDEDEINVGRVAEQRLIRGDRAGQVGRDQRAPRGHALGGGVAGDFQQRLTFNHSSSRPLVCANRRE